MTDEDDLDISDLMKEIHAMEQFANLLRIEDQLAVLIARLREGAASSTSPPTDLESRREELEIHYEIGELVMQWQRVRRKLRLSPALSRLSRRLSMELKQVLDHLAVSRLPDLVKEQYLDEVMTWSQVRERLNHVSAESLALDLGCDPSQVKRRS